MIPPHLLPHPVRDDLEGDDKIKTTVFLVALYVIILVMMFLVLHYAEAIDNWRP